MIVVIVVIVLGAAFLIHRQKMMQNDYSVVYLTTGEVYVGHLITFPDMELQGGYILRVSKDSADPTKNNFQLNPIAEALWAPKELYINRKNVVFYGPLLPTSKIAQTLASQKK